MIEPEISRPIMLDRIGLKEKNYEIAATEDERVALAKRLGIPSVESFEATIGLRLTGGGGTVKLRGHVRANLTQICVVTLEPIATKVDEKFTRLFTLEVDDDATEIVIEIDEDDSPDPVIDEQIDMGEAAAEHLALAMDPFPRSQGAAFEAPVEPEPEPVEKPSPFAALASLQKKE